MVAIDAKAFILDAATRMCGFEDYKFIMERYRAADVSKDEPFQRRFTYFYRVRRSREWLDAFYRLFQRLRPVENLGFERVLGEVAEISDGRVEISFASKMLATIRTEMPIWDKYVRINLDLPEIPPATSQGREKAAVAAYAELVEKANALLAREDVKREIRVFDEAFPAYASFSDMKKLDFLLWGANRVEG